MLQKLHQRVPELEKSTAVAVEKMRLEEAARRKLEERLISVSPTPKPLHASPLSLPMLLASEHICSHGTSVKLYTIVADLDVTATHHGISMLCITCFCFAAPLIMTAMQCVFLACLCQWLHESQCISAANGLEPLE